ncbi:MAG: hypothetical protein LBK05_03340, partial [Treponema sp.]|nr:hypothetical protein [Treponema sp.]
MKKIFLSAAAALLVSGIVFAQADTLRGQGRPPYDYGRRGAGEYITLTGTLAWMNGRIVLKTDDKTYFVSGIGRLAGFVEGFEEGATVTFAGISHDDWLPEYGYLFAQKVTVNGKDYALDGYRHGDRGQGYGYGRG